MSRFPKYYLANLAAKPDLRTLAAAIKARWICEQAHQQLKERSPGRLQRKSAFSWFCWDIRRLPDIECLKAGAYDVIFLPFDDRAANIGDFSSPYMQFEYSQGIKSAGLTPVGI